MGEGEGLGALQAKHGIALIILQVKLLYMSIAVFWIQFQFVSNFFCKWYLNVISFGKILCLVCRALNPPPPIFYFWNNEEVLEKEKKASTKSKKIQSKEDWVECLTSPIPIIFMESFYNYYSLFVPLQLYIQPTYT